MSDFFWMRDEGGFRSFYQNALWRDRNVTCTWFFYQYDVPGGVLPICRPWRDSTNITSLAGLEPYHSRFCYQYTVPGGVLPTCRPGGVLPTCRPWRDSTNMPSLVGLEPLIHIPFYQYTVHAGFYQYAVPGGTGTLNSHTFLPI